MPGAEVPDFGEIGEDTNTNAEQEVLLEELAEGVRRIPGLGFSGAVVDTISAGSITPDRGFVRVDTEGGAFFDNLDRIEIDNYLPESEICIRITDPARSVNIRNLQGGSGQIELVDSFGFTMVSKRMFLWLWLDGTTWRELDRSYGPEIEAERTFLGLGTAALLDNGSVNAATLEGLSAADFLPVGGTAANAAQLGGESLASLVRNNLASLQTLAGGLKAGSGDLSVTSAAANLAALFTMRVNDTARSVFIYEPISKVFSLTILDDDGSTLHGGLRIQNDVAPEYWDTINAEWKTFFDFEREMTPLFPTLGKIRWDKLDAEQEIDGAVSAIVHSEVVSLLPGTGATGIFKVSAGLKGRQTNNSSTKTLSVHLGQSGNDSDPEIMPSEASSQNGIDFDLPERTLILPIQPGDRFTLSLFNSGNRFAIEPSVLNGFEIESNTFLRVEQIG